MRIFEARRDYQRPRLGWRRSLCLVGDVVNGPDVGELFIRSREGISNHVGFALEVSDVGSKLGDTGELICLPDRLRISLFLH